VVAGSWLGLDEAQAEVAEQAREIGRDAWDGDEQDCRLSARVAPPWPRRAECQPVAPEKGTAELVEVCRAGAEQATE
jgi:hypothetical protein